ncbi:hypothetical protein LINPERPRIM_LOCUS37987, partial [Linum perenne]
ERRKRVHVAATEKQAEPETDSSPFSKELVNALEKLFPKMLSKAPPSQYNPPDIYSGLFANRGNRISTYSVNSSICYQWIIDLGCSNDMMGSKEVLDDYQCYPKKVVVRIAYGSLAPVEGIGRLRINQRKPRGGRLDLVNFMKTFSS